MATQLPEGRHLPVRPELNGGRTAHGFVTPKEDRSPQIMSVLPKRVLPIIFLPGIMGSNLRMSAARQAKMGKNNNIAWRPDNKAASLALSIADAAERQNQLDPAETEVDVYDPVNNPTGDRNETSDQRNEKVKVNFEYKLNVGINTPLMMDDPVSYKQRRLKEHKARERGWGEVFFDSYRHILEMCELRLNAAFRDGKPDEWWKQILDVPPEQWQAHPQPALEALDEKTLKEAMKDCWFPVHAMGYNWLQSNRNSGVCVAERISALIQKYQAQTFHCEKVILVTHSMGGLVARAVIHPDMGNLQDKVLGIVHGVMPAIGAGAAYKRMRCGFEDAWLSITPKVLGNSGPEVTAVLGNAQGGLELLPSQAYGNDWLRLSHKGKTIKSLPKNGDPYEEIYKLRGKWYCLLQEAWINPARDKDGGYDRTAALLDKAKAFHNAIAGTYHDQSYAHYGADSNHAAWHHVTWTLDDWAVLVDVENLRIVSDNYQGRLHVVDPKAPPPPGATTPGFDVKLAPPNEPGDQTVPLHSAEHQMQSGKFKGIFRQTGYEHQNSYQNGQVLNSTLYSLVRIAQTMVWSK
ncbi:hypothetical protein HSX11_20680 [Oxalobacteraceae bacterium]|nr:hypothetical protein [Oxalobacteraceae bacterium]